MLEEVVFDRLTSHLGLSAIVGSSIYPIAMPQGTVLPAVTYQRVSSPRVRGFGDNKGAVARVQVTAWAATYRDAKQVRAEIFDALEPTDGMYFDVTVRAVQCVNELDDYNPETKTYATALDFMIWYEGL
jgi:hypothetical protein